MPNLSTRVVVFNGYVIWSIILREQRTLKLFENRVPRKIFGSKGVGGVAEMALRGAYNP